MTTIRGLAGAVSILVAFWCLTPAAQESEIDVVRELLSRLERIEQRLKALEQKYQSAEDDDIVGNDREMQLKVVRYQLSRPPNIILANTIVFPFI